MTNLDFTAFRQNLRALIDSRNKLSKEVAEDIGATPVTISRYLTGAREPEVVYAVRLAEYFGVSLEWLLGLNDTKSESRPQEVREMTELYYLASDDDRRVINAVLDKYRAANESRTEGAV